MPLLVLSSRQQEDNHRARTHSTSCAALTALVNYKAPSCCCLFHSSTPRLSTATASSFHQVALDNHMQHSRCWPSISAHIVCALSDTASTRSEMAPRHYASKCKPKQSQIANVTCNRVRDSRKPLLLRRHERPTIFLNFSNFSSVLRLHR